MIVVVTGGRNFADEDMVRRSLDALPVRWLFHGGASGADTLAGAWALRREKVDVVVHRADWKRHGRAAGPKRNQEMLEAARSHCPMPVRVLAFPGGRGTADCVRRAEAMGLTVLDAAKIDAIRLARAAAILKGAD